MGRGGASADDPEDNPGDKKPIIPLDEGVLSHALVRLPRSPFFVGQERS